jgi:S1-C subfamily serine protease
VLLDGVTENSPAEKAGLKKGDIIIKFDGKTIENIEEFMEGLSGHKPGDSVEIAVKREGEEKSLKATLGTRPND